MSVVVNTNTSGGGGSVTSMTATALYTLAAAGGLTPNSWYVASDSGVRYWAPDASTLEIDSRATLWGPDFRRVLALGTSITNKWGDTGAASYTRTIGGDSYLFWMQTALGARIDSIINEGVSGNTTTQMLARYDSDVAAVYDSFDTLIFEPGPNDYVNSISAATAESNISKIIDYATAVGKFVVLLTPTISESFTSAQHAVCQEVRQWVIETYRASETVRVVDAAALMADPLTGLPLSALHVPTSVEALRTHPSLAGAQVMGRAIADIAANAPRVMPRTSLGSRDHYELIPNSRLTGNNASAARNFYAGAGVTVTGGPDSAAIGIKSGSFASVTIAPVTNTGESLASVSGGTRLTFGAAGADRSRVTLRCGSDDTGVSGTQYGRWDQTWAATTAQVVGDHRRLSASPLGVLTCITSGTSGGSAPAAPAAYGMTVADGSIVWVWQRLPAVGDVVVPEVEYEIEAQAGGLCMYASGTMYRTAGGAETWGESHAGVYDTGAGVPVGLPGLWMPRRGVLRGLPVTLADPAVSLRHVFVDLNLNFASGATATVRVDRMSLRRVSA